MNEDQLRALVRDSIAKHLGTEAYAPIAATAAAGSPPARQDVSCAKFVLPDSADGACIIEPAVQCTHCGFCKSYGH